MPLFICDLCGAVDNTALAEYWARPVKKCSECARGKWHGLFPKEQYDPKRHVGPAKPMNPPKEEHDTREP